MFVRYDINIINPWKLNNNDGGICEMGVLTATTRGNRKRRAALDGHRGDSNCFATLARPDPARLLV